ncbi:CidA/LrgA family protein [Siccirubricoccus sp. KC 17139]|uniref:CidA/LrgA family protein n=1 Tax=Siccirubricoccus soli TaxID=2899147 RepID=A0ABT1DD03_9PROT|nr:CidA/LrgA family protein [Siccirubricoccus soli]MCO6419811.1 CidA/LrgA family protein [Siccirubricoccus soli]MCP2685946.1 CidA/LrgA family protein [Siccirubricoccus soli]
MIGALAALLSCQLTGEVAVRALHLPVPGPVIGMVLLFLYLQLRGGEVPAPLSATAEALLGNLGLLFVPAGVGVVLYLPLLAQAWAPLGLAVLAGTLLTIAATGKLAEFLFRRLR